MGQRRWRGRCGRGTHRAVPGQKWNTSLHSAADSGYLMVVEKLLEAGADVGAKNEVRAPRRRGRPVAGGGAHNAGPGQEGDTPLHLAAQQCHLEVMKKLLAADADVGATNNVRDPGGGAQRFY
jgi:ankyrin repeat protein